MDDDRGIKRYEPLGFLLFLGMFSMLAVMGYALYKFSRNLASGQVVAPDPGAGSYLALAVLVLAFSALALASRFFLHQRFSAFRACLAVSFGASVLFVVLQVAGLPVGVSGEDPVQRGYYYLAFLSGVHLLFVLTGLVATALLLAQAYRSTAYVESFIFSVNPPNILNMKLVVRYWGFVTLLWVLVIVFVKAHVA